MQNGLIDLRYYLSSRSYNSIIKNFYLHKTLITYRFDEFKDLQLNTSYGKKSYFEKIELLVDQGFLKVGTIAELNAISISKANENNYFQITDLLNSEYEKYEFLQKNANSPESHLLASNANFQLLALEERLFALLHQEKYGDDVLPVSSLLSYETLDLSFPKANVYRVLIDNFPIPDETVPLLDIVQYRDEESNRLNFLRLRRWANNISEKNLSEKEIAEEIEYLITEFKREMELAGMKYKFSKFEFLFKLLPNSVEKVIKLSLSEILDPLFQLRKEKISLLEIENKATGNELAYVIKA
ncbi:hypothetical protein D0809_21020 [Flavobacterium circumlabens]|uniref:Uncharacterized protein n=1 Tax=Flavobacterium circumlabens TaxID=2133765 RepID=A0A4Y7U988_9FLAO|nr:hypothetical protein [Flavobacterium circumlabens]TCN53066.1 hypothetical protein EV142_10949 [Flavobacterium circumlabens]TEB42379.1 hypothetical protein D0809_21020 [Flavobacterium circumlabens]